MKLNKFTKTAVVFTLGASVFVTTAFADMLLGSGYDKLKESIKRSADGLTNEYASYTEIDTFNIYLDDEILYNSTNTLFVDNTNKRELNISDHNDFSNPKYSGKSESYRDTLYAIYKRDTDTDYYGYKYMTEDVEFVPGNEYNEFFQDEYAPYFEKIIDAAVGNMKNLVQYDTNANDQKVYTGSLNASQVPALYNAVLSLALKDGLDTEYRETKEIKEVKDAYVSEITGEAIEDNQGRLIKIDGQFSVKFKDQNSKDHTITAQATIEWKDINSTVVNKPTVDEASLESITVDNYSSMVFPEKYIGSYSTPIVIETEDKFVKIGERKVTVTAISLEKISGHYEEVLFDNEYTTDFTPVSFEFEQLKDGSYITYTNPANGEKNYATLSPDGGGGIYFDYGITYKDGSYIFDNVSYNNDSDIYLDSRFERIFE